MELSEQLTAMTAERNQYKEMVDNLSAKVFSLDKALLKAYQENIIHNEDIYKLNKVLTDLNNQIQELMNDKNELHQEKINMQFKIEELTPCETTIEL